MRRQIIILAALVAVAGGVSAQIRNPGSGCTPSELYYCQLWPDTCTCSSPVISRVAPVERLPIPRRIGVVALAQDGGFNGIWRNPDGYRNHVAAEEVVGYGISAIHLWPMVSLTDEHGWWPLPEGDDHRDMTWVFENSGLDLIVIRPMQHSFSELACDGLRAAVWEGGDWGEYAERLYARFGDRRITVILLNWEGDWQLWGARCREPNECPTGDIWPTQAHGDYVACDGDYDCQVGVCDGVRLNRAWYLRKLFEERQAAILAARMAHPDAALTVLFGITVNHTEDTEQMNVTRDVIPFLEHQPDVIALSHWDAMQSVTDALYYIRDHTNHARYNTILIETGAKVGATQEQKVFDVVDAAMSWGVQAAFVWSWRYTGAGADLGIISADNTTNGSMEAIQRLIKKYER